MMDPGDDAQGCLDLHGVEKMCVHKDKADVVLDLVTGSRTWHFSTSEKEVLAYWIEIFTGSCPMLSWKDRLESDGSFTASNGSSALGTERG